MSRLANFCTALRILIAPLLVWQLSLPREAAGMIPFVLYVAAALSDYVDGMLARASGTASRLGRAFDHGADALLLFPIFWMLASLGRVPTVLPIVAMTAFALYVGHGWQRGGSVRRIDLTSSRSGAVGGVLNYVVAGAATAAVWIDVRGLDQAIYAAAYAVSVVNLAAAIERLPLLVTPARESPAAKTEARAPRSSP